MATDSYYVFDHSNRQFGPVDMQTISVWMGAGRIDRRFIVENVVDGSRRSVAELITAGELAEPPPSLSRPKRFSRPSDYEELLPPFSWGAFMLGPIWGFWFGVPWLFAVNLAVAIVIPSPLAIYLSLAFGIYCGVMGYRWAAASGRFASNEELRETMEKWDRAAIGVIVCFLLIAGLFTLAALGNARR